MDTGRDDSERRGGGFMGRGGKGDSERGGGGFMDTGRGDSERGGGGFMGRGGRGDSKRGGGGFMGRGGRGDSDDSDTSDEGDTRSSEHKTKRYNKEQTAEKVKKAILNYRPSTALNHVKKMPGFKTSFQKFVHRELQKESDQTAADFNEPGPLTYSRQQVTSFSPEEYHEKLTSKAPLLMAALTGTCSKQKLEDIQVRTIP